jgi:peptidoglycan hydrolase-like protein with peptidoglycan-binding domain
MRIISRAEWGARYGDGSRGQQKREHVIIHTTVTPILSPQASFEQEAAQVRGMERFHVVNRGFNGIAYSFLIADSGRIYEGRGWGQNGAHTQSGRNSDGHGIAFIGDGTKKPPTRQAWESLVWLLQEGIKRGSITSPYRLSGHRDWWRKACPGDLIYSVMHAEAANVGNRPARPSDYVVGLGDKNDLVRVWQQQLIDGFGEKLDVDGIFGPITEAATKRFEEAYGLPVDGYASTADTARMEELYKNPPQPHTDDTAKPDDEPAAEPTGPEVVEPRDYKFAVRYGKNSVDERIARALAAAMHLHVAPFDDASTAEVAYLVGGQAAREYDRARAGRVVEFAGETRKETLQKVAAAIEQYIMKL